MAETPGRDAAEGATVSVALDITVAGRPMHVEIAIDAAPASAAALIPIARALNEAISGRVVEVVAAAGQAVSCRKGCAACCRQPVPISMAEARTVHGLVAAMPAPRQESLRRRFAAARETLREAGLLDAVSGRAAVPHAELPALAARYRRLGLACPFLEDEACSIHPDRPLVCRDYLVTSPPAACADPDGLVRPVPSPAAVSTAMMAADPETTEAGGQWIALATALDWVDAHPAPEAPVDGQQLLQRFLSHLFQRELPPPGTGPGAGMLGAAR
jgi:Fe-S-cluster containining protein